LESKKWSKEENGVMEYWSTGKEKMEYWKKKPKQLEKNGVVE